MSKFAAACGGIFAIGLFVAVGDDSAFASWRSVAATVALALFVPFLAGLHGHLRRRDPSWLPTTALAAGLVGITLKLASGAPDIAAHRAGGATQKLFDALGGALTVISFYPLALFCGAVAVLTLRSGALPRWLGIGGAITAAALAINGAFVNTDAAPAMLLFLLWTLAASVTLYRPSISPELRPGFEGL